MLRKKKLIVVPVLLLLILSRGASSALAAIFDPYADAVLGQPDFTAFLANNGGISAQSLNKPGGIAVDPVSGRLYVADTFNNRVLSWPGAASFINHAAADLVFGQGGVFNTNTANKGGISAGSLNSPNGLAVDSQHNLYVADTNNHRILRFDNPPINDTTADAVFGQGGEFTTNSPNQGGPSANSLNWPGGLAIDSSGNLYVADKENNRMLRYNAPLSDTQADLVLGQPDFATTTIVPSPTAASLNQPEGVAVDAAGNVYVADTANWRVLGFVPPHANGNAATRVFGQESLTANVEYCILVPAADNLCNPIGIFVDSSGVLYVSDVQFDRVLLFYTPLSGAPPVNADEVIGQPDFTSENTPKPPFSYGLDYPNAVFVDSQRNLYLSDSNNSRVLRFDTVGASDFIYLPINYKPITGEVTTLFIRNDLGCVDPYTYDLYIFGEIVNNSSVPVDMSNWDVKIYDGSNEIQTDDIFLDIPNNYAVFANSSIPFAVLTTLDRPNFSDYDISLDYVTGPHTPRTDLSIVEFTSTNNAGFTEVTGIWSHARVENPPDIVWIIATTSDVQGRYTNLQYQHYTNPIIDPTLPPGQHRFRQLYLDDNPCGGGIIAVSILGE